MALALLLAVRPAPPPDHANDAHHIGNGGNEAGLQVGEAEALDDGGQKEAQAVIGGVGAEIDQGDRQHLGVGHRLHHAEAALCLPLAALQAQPGHEPLALIRQQPMGISGLIGQVGEHDERQDQRRRRLQDVEPLPAMQAEHPVHAEQHAGDWRADHRGERDGGHEHADDARPLGSREPQGEEEDDAREEAGLGKAQQHADDVKAGRAGDEGHCPREDAPGEHDPGDPLARAEALQHQVGGDFEHKVGEEEDTGAKPERGLGQADIMAHGELGETHVHPVEIGNEVAQDQEWQQPHRDAAKSPALKFHDVISLAPLPRGSIAAKYGANRLKRKCYFQLARKKRGISS